MSCERQDPNCWRTSASPQGLVQVKYAKGVNPGGQYLRRKAFEFAATLINLFFHLHVLLFCYVCVVIICSTSLEDILLGLFIVRV